MSEVDLTVVLEDFATLSAAIDALKAAPPVSEAQERALDDVWIYGEAIFGEALIALDQYYKARSAREYPQNEDEVGSVL